MRERRPRWWIAMACAVLAGCTGPIALQRAIWHQHEQEYAAAMAFDDDAPKAAWYAYRAEQTGQTVEQVRDADLALSTTRNPFHANADPEAVSRGAVIFRAHCSRCHGLDAQGDGRDLLPDHATRDFHAFSQRFAATLHGGAPRTWFRKINGGFGDEVQYADGPSTAMPAFGDVLACEQIWLVITYLQSLDCYAKADPAAAEHD